MQKKNSNLAVRKLNKTNILNLTSRRVNKNSIIIFKKIVLNRYK